MKKHVQAETAKVERDFWENQISAWKDSVEEARMKEEQRQAAKMQYQRDLQLQMENNNNILQQKKTEDSQWANMQDSRYEREINNKCPKRIKDTV